MSRERAIADGALIGGHWVAAQSGRRIEVRNPSTDELIATVPEGGAADVTAAIDAAHAALPGLGSEPWQSSEPRCCAACSSS